MEKNAIYLKFALKKNTYLSSINPLFSHLSHYCNTLTVTSYSLFCVSEHTKRSHATGYDCVNNYDMFRFFVRFSSASLAILFRTALTSCLCAYACFRQVTLVTLLTGS